MSEIITQEKAIEYKQMAALACLKIDMLLEMTKMHLSSEEWEEQVKDAHKEKESWITNPAERAKQYNTGQYIFSLITNDNAKPS